MLALANLLSSLKPSPGSSRAPRRAVAYGRHDLSLLPRDAIIGALLSERMRGGLRLPSLLRRGDAFLLKARDETRHIRTAEASNACSCRWGNASRGFRQGVCWEVTTYVIVACVVAASGGALFGYSAENELYWLRVLHHLPAWS